MAVELSICRGFIKIPNKVFPETFGSLIGCANLTIVKLGKHPQTLRKLQCGSSIKFSYLDASSLYGCFPKIAMCL